MRRVRWGVELVTPLEDEIQSHGVMVAYRWRWRAVRRARREAAADRRLNQLQHSRWVAQPIGGCGCDVDCGDVR